VAFATIEKTLRPCWALRRGRVRSESRRSHPSASLRRANTLGIADGYSRVVPVFVASGIIIGLGLILFALRPGPWVFNITEESLRTPPGSGYHREWWSEAELDPRSRPWGEQAKELIDWTALKGHAARLGQHMPRRAEGAPIRGCGSASTAMV
jgi:hypothetical protein